MTENHSGNPVDVSARGGTKELRLELEKHDPAQIRSVLWTVFYDVDTAHRRSMHHDNSAWLKLLECRNLVRLVVDGKIFSSYRIPIHLRCCTSDPVSEGGTPLPADLWPHLVDVRLLNVGLTCVPELFRTRLKRRLETVCLNSNRGISCLPDWIGELTSLRRLHLEDCKIKTLTSSLADIPDLEELALRHNRDLEIPDPEWLDAEDWWDPESVAERVIRHYREAKLRIHLVRYQHQIRMYGLYRTPVPMPYKSYFMNRRHWQDGLVVHPWSFNTPSPRNSDSSFGPSDASASYSTDASLVAEVPGEGLDDSRVLTPL